MKLAFQHYRIALIVPCYNEAQTIAQVITDFKKALPNIDCYVFDNNSTDKTLEFAGAAGARLSGEWR